MKFLIRQNPLYAAPSSAARRLKYLVTGEMVVPILDETDNEYAMVSVGGQMGWVRANLLEDFLDPFPASTFHLPGDAEIESAILTGRAAQFIRLDAIGIKRIHNNLCGEFCVAGLAGKDVIPTLRAWRANDKRAESILSGNKGTGLGDLTSLLGIFGLSGISLRYDANNPPSPGKLAEIAPAILGVGINGAGAIVRGGYVRHWVVLLDVLRAGSGGITRVYNPYHNRLEIVNYESLLEAGGWLSAIGKIGCQNEVG